MNSLFESLLLTTESSLILGFSLAICVASSFLCFSFYYKFRHKSLLNLCAAILAFQFMMLMYDHNPTQFNVLQANPILKRIAHFSGGLIVFCFYRLFMSACEPFPSYKFLTAKFYQRLLLFVLSVRAAVIVFPEAVELIRAASFSNVIFYMTTLFLTIRYKSATRSTLWIRIGCGIGVIGLTVYPLIRAGIIDSSYLRSVISYILITTITLFSVFSLIGVIELGREYLERAEMSSLRNMARAFIQLRDLVNTPFQTIDLSVRLLRQRHPEEAPALQKIESSLDVLRRVDAALAKYEINVDWKQTEDFIAVDSVAKP